MGNKHSPNCNLFPEYKRNAIIQTITTVIFAPILGINRPLGMIDINGCHSESSIATNSFLGNLICYLHRLVEGTN